MLRILCGWVVGLLKSHPHLENNQKKLRSYLNEIIFPIQLELRKRTFVWDYKMFWINKFKIEMQILTKQDQIFHYKKKISFLRCWATPNRKNNRVSSKKLKHLKRVFEITKKLTRT